MNSVVVLGSVLDVASEIPHAIPHGELVGRSTMTSLFCDSPAGGVERYIPKCEESITEIQRLGACVGCV